MFLFWPQVAVRVRKCDVAAAESVLAEAAKLYKEAVSKATDGFVPDLAPLTIDTTYLPPAYSADNAEDFCSGGVVLVARRGRILCKNTLDARLDISFHKLTPSLRGMLFGERAPPPNAGKHDEAAHGHGH
jgi:V-type H+-transporting ATPase subunit E